jgi:hypothetical protein
VPEGFSSGQHCSACFIRGQHKWTSKLMKREHRSSPFERDSRLEVRGFLWHCCRWKWTVRPGFLLTEVARLLGIQRGITPRKSVVIAHRDHKRIGRTPQQSANPGRNSGVASFCRTVFGLPSPRIQNPRDRSRVRKCDRMSGVPFSRSELKFLECSERPDTRLPPLSL